MKSELVVVPSLLSMSYIAQIDTLGIFYRDFEDHCFHYEGK